LAALWPGVRAALGAKPMQWRGEVLTRTRHGFAEFTFSKGEFALYRQPWQAYYALGRTGRAASIGNAG
jgi:hypothetical protein